MLIIVICLVSSLEKERRHQSLLSGFWTKSISDLRDEERRRERSAARFIYPSSKQSDTRRRTRDKVTALKDVKMMFMI
jgi:hypothetical protein